MPTNRTNPDCSGGKHDACNGDAWDQVRDVACSCVCTCHLTEPIKGWTDYDIPVDPASLIDCESCQ